MPERRPSRRSVHARDKRCTLTQSRDSVREMSSDDAERGCVALTVSVRGFVTLEPRIGCIAFSVAIIHVGLSVCYKSQPRHHSPTTLQQLVKLLIDRIEVHILPCHVIAQAFNVGLKNGVINFDSFGAHVKSLIVILRRRRENPLAE